MIKNKGISTKALLLSLSLLTATSFATELRTEIVDFYIVNGTGSNSWNTADTMVMAQVGQTLRIHNQDTTKHQLHTNGAPCDHGEVIAPGTSWDCYLAKEYDETKNGPLYEHNVGRAARFYFKAVK